VKLAGCLIGKVAAHDVAGGRLSGRIVETEAYPIGDSAGHAFHMRTPRKRGARRWGGVLLRALQPLEGIDLMRRSRSATRLTDLARGPGRLAEAMGIDLRQNGLDLCAPGPLWLAATEHNTGVIGHSVRIGLSRNADRRWRFCERGNPYVSGRKRLRE